MRRRFGILAFPVAPYDALSREVRWAEEIGFDNAWIPDTFSNPSVADFEPWTLLAALATSTSKIRIGTLITTIISRHPTLLAAEALTVDHLSGGRLEVGLGVGDTPEECDWLGVPRWPPAERVARLEEQVALLDELLRGNEVTRAGTYYATRGARLGGPRQRPRPPLLVSAEGPRALRIAARYADAWSTLGRPSGKVWAGGTTEAVREAEALSSTKAKIAELERRAAEFGRAPHAIRRVVLAYRQPVDALSSLDAFDHFVGSYAEIGLDEFVFYWPPLQHVKERSAVSAERRGTVERIAASRLGRMASAT
jgi:alkanesulfonate monooxygenase SsuD/methylene tetrahydromethanopterin reductase-like flavin-dependent oxidoreductase (luciferase family)